MMRIENTLRIQGLFANLVILAIFGFGASLLCPMMAVAEDRSTRQTRETCLTDLFGKPLGEIRLDADKTEKNFPALLPANQKKTLSPEKLEANIQKFCPRNGNNSIGSSGGVRHNRFNFFDKKPSLKLPGLEERKIEKDGICEATYEAIAITRAELKKFGESICADRAQIDEESKNCVTADTTDRECVGKLKKAVDKFIAINADNKTARTRLGDFLQNTAKLTDQVIEKYEKDRAHLYQQSLATPRSATPTFADSTPFVPSEFGALNSDQYLQWVGKDLSAKLTKLNDTSGKQYRQIEGAELVNEQVLALSFLLAYSAKVSKAMGEDLNAESAAKIRAYRDQIATLEARLPGDNDWKKWAEKSPTAVAAAAPLLQQGPAAAASGIAGAGTIAALGAGAALGSQAAGGRSSATLGDVLPKQQAPNPVAPLEKTKITEGNGGANEQPLGSGNQTPGTKAPATEKPEVKEAAGNPVGANPAVFSSGASFKQNGFKPRSTKASAAAAGDLGSAGKTDESLRPFGGELLAGPAPKKVDSTGDVSSLLGQMKDLFNFDDTGGMPGGTEGMPNLGQAGAFSGQEGALPGEGPAEEFTGAEVGDEESGRQFASQEEEIIGSPTQVRAYLGGIETPLFKRVKSRHKRCMEKGLVILGLGKIPQ